MNANPAWNDDQMSFFEVDLSLSAQTFSLIQSSTTCDVSAICLQLDTETGNLKKIILAFSKKNKTERRLNLINHFGSPKGTYYKPKFYFSQVEENFMAVKQTLKLVSQSMDHLVLKNHGLFQIPYIENKIYCLCILLALFW